MPFFKYTAINSSGKRVRGSLETNDRKQALLKLKNELKQLKSPVIYEKKSKTNKNII